MKSPLRPDLFSDYVSSSRLLGGLLGLLVLMLLFISGAFAQAFVPEDDSTIVEILPDAVIALSHEARVRGRRTTTEGIDAAGALSAATDVQKADIQGHDLLRRALTAYQIALSDQDPRAYGHTLTLLNRWPSEHPKPPLIHILTAAVLQHNHAFQRALAELDSALLIEPENVQALLMKAQINLVTADYDEVRKNCGALRPLVRAEISLNCEAQLESLTGQAEVSLDTVRTRLTTGITLIPQDLVELHTTAATIAHRLGYSDQAEQHYRSALQLVPESGYLLVHYGSLLLESGRPEDVLTLLSRLPEDRLSTELKIVQAEALLAAEPKAALHERISELQVFFDSAFLREEAPHKEYARFALNILQDAELALKSAQENWALQKEPSDTLLLARAASATGNAGLLQDLADWIAAAGTEDVRLTELFSRARTQNAKAAR